MDKEAVFEPPSAMAVSTAGCEAATVPATTVNAADILPAFTVTEAGTVSAGLFEDKATAVAAAREPVSLTVHVVEAPARRTVAAQVTESRDGGGTRTMAYLAVPPSTAVIVTPVFAVTCAAEAVNCAEV